MRARDIFSIFFFIVCCFPTFYFIPGDGMSFSSFHAAIDECDRIYSEFEQHHFVNLPDLNDNSKKNYTYHRCP